MVHAHLLFVLKWPMAVASRPARLFDDEGPASSEPLPQPPSQTHEHQRRLSAGTVGQVWREKGEAQAGEYVFSFLRHSGVRPETGALRLGQ